MAKNKKGKLRNEFDTIFDKLGVINQPKTIIKNGKLPVEFEANGVKYVIAPMEKAFNFERQIAYQNFEVAFSLNQTPQEIADRFIKQYHNQIRLMQATGDNWIKIQDENLRECLNSVDSMKGEHTKRLAPAYLMCTLFIIREGEDLSSWSWELAHQKIDDWVKANLNPFDFFTLALQSSKNSLEILRESLEDI